MPAVTIDLSEPTLTALELCAAQNGRSTEAETRDSLDEVVSPPVRIKPGSALAAIGRQFGGVELDIERDRTPAGAVSFD